MIDVMRNGISRLFVNGSATGGADSRPASTGGTPTEEQPAGVGNGKRINIHYIYFTDFRGFK